MLAGCAANSAGSPPAGSAASTASSALTSSSAPDPASAAAQQAAADRLAAAFARAAELQDAAVAAGWTGPICNPDANLHREQAGQPPLTDDEWAADCEARIAEAETLIANE